MLELLFGGGDTETTAVVSDSLDYDRSGEVTFDDAYVNFMEGGGHLGLGCCDAGRQRPDRYCTHSITDPGFSSTR